ncbi:hypothetical protein VE03_08659 [Pseudogymnoascus sp. 23342-1-I1]|nr:hypothetical protein VE03_08659 [Pseudogymnoascus sp. 23342-1-I1]
MADGFNNARATRVADLLSDFRALQHSIASVTCDPPHPDDFYTEGYAALRQCSVDGQHVLNVAADTRVPTGRGGQAEQEKAELTQELATVTDENIYNLMRNSDYTMGRWTDEDPSLRNVQRWLRSRR